MNPICLFALRAVHFVLRHLASADAAIEKRLNDATADRADYRLLFPPGKVDAFFERIHLITHAGGGLSGLSYLNCEEAYETYRTAGNTVFEYDVDRAEDGTFVLTHDGDGRSLIDERFHPMPLEHCLAELQSDEALILIFDCKFSDLTEFAERLIIEVPAAADQERIVIQVFNAENIRQVRQVGPFKMLFVCMMGTDYTEAANLCLENGIGAVSVSEKALRERKGWDVFPRSNIRIYAYTVNRVQDYRVLRGQGVWGVFSDFLTESDIR
ncbi:MAG: hypothetical protein K6G17_09140 [Oscillospiraceae bacterium]|nr:hypothetical protein [Oscillospiraceae bacterium]